MRGAVQWKIIRNHLSSKIQRKLCSGSSTNTRQIFTDQVIFIRSKAKADPAPYEHLMQQSIKPTVKYSGNIQVWGHFAFSGTSDSHWMNYTLTKEKYHSIRQRHAIRSDLKLCGKGFIFQSDNGSKNAVTLCQVCLKSGEECWRACLYLHSHQTSAPPNIFGNIWKGKRWKLL